MTLPDLFGATEARDEGLARVSAKAGAAWEGLAFSKLAELSGFEGTVEDIKIRMQLKGLTPPHHHNEWGAWTLKAIKRGLLIFTGRSRQTVSRRAHRRVAKVYLVRS
jgi:hypothetical protein